jgi:RNA polymerase sigma factor (sigma-70 family)
MTTQDQAIDWETELPLHREWMLRVARFRLGDPHSSEDLVQGVLLSVVHQDPLLAEPGKLRGWLYQAVIRRISDHLRKQYREQKVVGEISTMESAKHEENGWDWMLAKEQRHVLGVAIERLDPLERQIILLKFTQSRSYKEIGESLGLSPRAVEYQLVRAKQKLRIELQKVTGNERE